MTDTCPPNRHCWGIGPEPAPDERDHEAAEQRAGRAAESPGAHHVAAHQRGHDQRDVGEGQPAPQAPGAGTEDEGGEGQPQQGAAEVQGRELQPGTELRQTERGEERGPHEEPGPDARGQSPFSKASLYLPDPWEAVLCTRLVLAWHGLKQSSTQFCALSLAGGMSSWSQAQPRRLMYYKLHCEELSFPLIQDWALSQGQHVVSI